MGFQHSDLMQFDSLIFRKDFDRWVQWIGDSYSVFNFWKSKVKIYVGVDAIIVSILNFDTLCLISALLRWFDDGSDNTALLLWFLLNIRSVNILDTTVRSGSFVWLFSQAWDAVKPTLPGDWPYLSFRGHWPYRVRSDDGSCSRTNAWQFSYLSPTQNPCLFTLQY